MPLKYRDLFGLFPLTKSDSIPAVGSTAQESLYELDEMYDDLRVKTLKCFDEGIMYDPSKDPLNGANNRLRDTNQYMSHKFIVVHAYEFYTNFVRVDNLPDIIKGKPSTDRFPMSTFYNNMREVLGVNKTIIVDNEERVEAVIIDQIQRTAIKQPNKMPSTVIFEKKRST